MAFETKPGQGTLWGNDKKSSEKSPNSTGDAICPCCQNRLKLAGWTKTTQNGRKLISLKLTPVDETAQAPTPDDTSTPWD